MGDDPYDFEIAIPAAGGGGAIQKSGRGGADKLKSYGSRRHGASNDDDDSSDVSVSDDDEEEDESAESIDVKKPTPKSKVQARPSARGAVAPTSSSSSALDKAKNFLSKYSTKAVDTKASKTPQVR